MNRILEDFLTEGHPFKTLRRKVMAHATFLCPENAIARRYVGPKTLNVGAGNNRIPGTVSFDNESHWKCNPDIYGDANNLWALVSHDWDTVIAAHIVEHLNDPEAFYMQVHDILKPGGYFVLICPNFETMGSVGYYRDKTHRHEMVPGREWARFRRDRGWDVVQFNRLAFRWPLSFDLVVRKK